MPIIRRSDCVPLPIVVCPVVAVVMLESQVARCVQCVENVACYAGNILHTVQNKEEVKRGRWRLFYFSTFNPCALLAMSSVFHIV